MSIIYSYPEETSLQGSDMLIGTSTALVGGKQKNITKNFTLDQLSSFIQGGEGVINPAATDFQIAVFNQSGSKITGSIMSQDVYPNGTGITVSGNLSTTGNLVAPGAVTLGSGSNLIDLTSTTKLSGPVIDSIGNAGTLNQILLVNNEGKLIWGNYTSGLTYQGLWDADQNDPVLGSSIGTNSTFYIVGTAGNTVLNGNTDWQVGDWAIFVGTTGAGGIWQKIDNTSSITGNGTLNRMVMWSSNFTVTDGPLLDSSGTNVLSILDRSILPSVSNARDLGSAALKWNMLYVNDIETTNINILSHVDLNSLPGTPGQVLTSSGVGAPAVWTTPTTGTITGAGTTNKIPLWTNNVAIGDSILTQLNAATPFTDTYLSVGSGGVSTTGLKVDGFFVDSTGSKGTAGQILSSTGTATLWKTGEDSSVTYSLAAGAQDGSSVPINLTDSLNVTTPVKITGGTNVNVVRTSDTEITLSSTNTTYDFGSSTSGSDVLLNLVGTPADNSSVKLIGSGVTIAQTNDEVTFTVPAGDTYDLNAGVKSGTSVPLNLTSGSGADNSVVNLTEGTGITLTQTSATEITIAGVAQGVTGSGTVNKLPKFDTTTSLTDSIVSEVSGVSLTKASAFRVDGTINFAGLAGCNPAGGGQVNCIMDDVATVDLSTDPFGFVANDGKVSFIGFNFSNSTEADAFRSLYGVSAPAGGLPPCSDGGGTISNSVNVTVNFDNGGTITFNVPSGNIGFNCGNDIGFGVYKLGLNASTKGQAITYVSGSGSISNGDATVSEVKVSIGGELDMNTANKIINLAQPTASQDAATKAYADTKLPLAGGTVTGPIVLPADPTLNLQAATKAYVDSNVVGSLVFQGGYDAVLNDPDLTTSPNSILKGWTYAVTNGPSTSFWNPPLNVGDLVIANIDNPTSVADWTEVQSNVGFAGSGATDGATVKGIAGFNSADFDVSNDGWVEAKDFTGTTPGYVPDATGADPGTFLKEDGTWAVAGTGTVTGTGAAGQVTFWDGTSNINGDADFSWDNTNKRLGIGTTSPSAKLDVTDNNDTVYVSAGGDQWEGIRIVNTSPTEGDNKFSQLGFYVDGGTNVATGAIGLVQPDEDSRGGDLYFKTKNAGGTTAERMRIDSAGNVGIGTTSPASTLEISKNDQTNGATLSITNSFEGGSWTAGDTVGSIDFKITDTSTAQKVRGQIKVFDDAIINQGTFPAYNAMSFSTANVGVLSERMRIASNGNVGIGTTTFNATYDAKLQVTSAANDGTGGVLIQNYLPTLTLFDTSGGASASQLQQDGTNMVFKNNGSERMRINSSGSVGIGTTNPAHTLDVSKSLANTWVGAIKNTNSAGLGLFVQGSEAANTAILGAYSGTSYKLWLRGDGKLGIGTNNPGVSLDINANDAVKVPVGTTTQRDAITPAAGMFRYNSTLGEFEGYTTEWGSIGGGGASATITTQNAVGDGTNLTFALGATPNGGSSSFVDVFIDGVYQEISTYTISGTNLVFNAGNAPAAGTNVETKTTADYNVGAAVQTVNGASGDVSTKDVPVVKTNASPEAVATQNQHLYVLYGSAAVTLTLPSNPAAGDYIKISNLSTLTTNVVAQAGSGERIMGVAANLTLDNATASFQLIYSGASDPGWVVVGPA